MFRDQEFGERCYVLENQKQCNERALGSCEQCQAPACEAHQNEDKWCSACQSEYQNLLAEHPEVKLRRRKITAGEGLTFAAVTGLLSILATFFQTGLLTIAWLVFLALGAIYLLISERRYLARFKADKAARQHAIDDGLKKKIRFLPK